MRNTEISTLIDFSQKNIQLKLKSLVLIYFNLYQAVQFQCITKPFCHLLGSRIRIRARIPRFSDGPCVNTCQ